MKNNSNFGKMWQSCWSKRSLKFKIKKQMKPGPQVWLTPYLGNYYECLQEIPGDF